MKLAVRIVALTVVLAGAAAASVSSNSHVAPSHLAVSAAMPIPVCVPGIPTCPKNASN
jgi:hypothetical protein